MKDVAVFARLASRPIPRVLRMMCAARGLGFENYFLAARRQEDLDEIVQHDDYQIRRIGNHFPLLNGRWPIIYLRGVIGYNLAFFKELWKRRPGLVHCSDIETMPAAILYRTMCGCRLIYNIHDNLSERYSLPAIFRALLNTIEGLFVLSASIALVPEHFRRESLPSWCRKKVQIVRNTPEDRGESEPPSQNRPIKIFFGGWLDRGRGLTELLSLARSSDEFQLTIAGEGAPEIVEEIKSTPNTRFLGFISHEEIMQETARNHVVAALYDPARPINRHAASNKLAEALSVGRPVLVNTEMLITSDLGPYNCLITIPYSEFLSKAAQLLQDLLPETESGAYKTKCTAARRAYDDLYSWKNAETAMKKYIRG